MPSRWCADCGQLFDTAAGGSRCPTCKPKANQARQARYDRHRPSAWRRGYNSDYHRNSAPILAAAKACSWCGREFTQDLPATMDHVTPLSHGGTNDPSNLVAACKPCNSSRGSHLRRGRPA
jgi:5-methylcytosine-specific restriction endonuclease McrA